MLADTSSDHMAPPSRAVACCLIFLSAVTGGLAIPAFGLFLFLGLPGRINLHFTPVLSLCFDAILSLLFFVQHSLMIRKRLKPTFLGDAGKGAFYSIFSGLTLFVIMIFWQKSFLVHFDIKDYSKILVVLLLFPAIVVGGWGLLSLSNLDPLGITALKHHLAKIPFKSPPFITKGAYRFVRHPLYLSCLLFIWSSPSITADRLLMNLLWTIWIVIGTILEEKDLVARYGSRYRTYQKHVGMLFPRLLNQKGNQ
ncbi:MAG: methyltransferase [Desulfobacterales bacterium]|jgi:protein-S-isoprenylcysteine O-methyltransferase Ste14|nr:methyltransferase [Desulfobacterales bacterium]